MINAFFIFNHRGDILISEIFKEGVKKNIADVFRIQVILNTETSKSPILTLGSTTFLHIRHNDVYFVVVTRSNSDASVIFEFLYAFKGLLDQYFQGLVKEELIRLNFLLINDLLEEVVVLGYPQSMNFSLLRKAIPPPDISRSLFNRSHNSGNTGNGISTVAKHSFMGFKKPSKLNITTDSSANLKTFDTPWRSLGIKHKKNEIFLEVIESLNVLISANGSVLRSFINGEIEMICKLSGMPQCVMKLQEISSQLQDFQFHRCVDLEKFDSDRVVSFVPPDGEFKILNYKNTGGSGTGAGIKLPFNVNVKFEDGSNRGRRSVHYKIVLKSLFDMKSTATDFLLKIPVSFLPITDDNYNYETTSGQFKYNKTMNCFEWKIPKFQGLIENSLLLDIQPESISAIQSTASTSGSNNSTRPPIQIANFEILSMPSSLQMNYFNVLNESYRPVKWIRYITNVESYEIRY